MVVIYTVINKNISTCFTVQPWFKSGIVIGRLTPKIMVLGFNRHRQLHLANIYIYVYVDPFLLESRFSVMRNWSNLFMWWTYDTIMKWISGMIQVIVGLNGTLSPWKLSSLSFTRLSIGSYNDRRNRVVGIWCTDNELIRYEPGKGWTIMWLRLRQGYDS